MAYARGGWSVFAALSSVLLFFVAGCDRSPPATQPATAESMKQADWPSFVDKFIEDYFLHYPSVAASAGRHEFDGQLPDWSAEGLQKTIAWLSKARDDAGAFAEGTLSPEQRFQRDYLIRRSTASCSGCAMRRCRSPTCRTTSTMVSTRTRM